MVVWFHYILHHLRQEGTVIRRAPLAVILTGAIFAWGYHFYDKDQYQGLIVNAQSTSQTDDSTIENLQAQIAQLQEELRGTSPQLAAIQAGRDKIRKKLQEFYLEGGFLAERPVKSASDVKILAQDTEKWENEVKAWAVSNLGEAASYRLFDFSIYPMAQWMNAFNGEHQNTLSIISYLRRNLSALVETAAWDGKSPEKAKQ